MNYESVTVRYVAARMIGLAVFAYILALVLGALPEKAHIDFAAIVLIIVAAAGVTLLFSPRWDATFLEALTRIRAFQFASLKIELDAIRAQQDEQTSRLELLQLLASLVLTDAEQKHLLNLHHHRTAGYKGAIMKFGRNFAACMAGTVMSSTIATSSTLCAANRWRCSTWSIATSYSRARRITEPGRP